MFDQRPGSLFLPAAPNFFRSFLEVEERQHFALSTRLFSNTLLG